MILVLSLIVLFLNFVTVYNDIKLDLRSEHSRTFLRKNGKGKINKLFFTPYINDIKKSKYCLLIINYSLSLTGLIFQLLLTFDFINDNNLILIGFVKILIIYAVTLFIYKTLITRVFSAINETDTLSVLIILFCILVYVIIFLVIPIFRDLFFTI